MKIAVVGTGYVGLVVGACLAEHGNDVVCVDGDEARLRALRRGRIPQVEPRLEELVRRNREQKRRTVTNQLAAAVRKATVVFITVDSPQAGGEAAAQASVEDVARGIARAMNGYKVIAGTSRVPIGTAARLREIIRLETTHPFSVVSNPESLRRGTAVEDFLNPECVVIGVEDPRATQVMTELYSSFTRAGAPVMMMDCTSAEVSAYAANALLAARLSVLNELALVCELSGADVSQVRRAVGGDRRAGPLSSFVGIGYGRGAFAADAEGLVRFAADRGRRLEALEAVGRVNAALGNLLVDKMVEHLGSLARRTIAVWGLALEPGSDDVRGAPAVAIVDRLLEAGAKVHAYDPGAGVVARGIFGNRVKLTRRSYDALVGADALVLATEWSEFRAPDFPKMKKLMRSPVVFDGRNVYNREQMKADGFTYFAIGR